MLELRFVERLAPRQMRFGFLGITTLEHGVKGSLSLGFLGDNSRRPFFESRMTRFVDSGVATGGEVDFENLRSMLWASTDVGISDWDEGERQLEWRVPDDITDLKFACTFDDHYGRMSGTFSISP